MTDVLVIGAGLGGLCAAIELAADGHHVEVIEAAPGPGGKVGVSTFEGVEFDTGPSVLTLPDVFDSVFRKAGSSLETEVTLRDTSFRYVWPDGTELKVGPDTQSTLRSVETTLGIKAKRELELYLEHARSIWETAAPNFVFGEAPGWGTLARLAVTRPRDLAKIDPARNYSSSIKYIVRTPALQDILHRYATYNGSDPRSAPATLGCIAWVELGLGGFGVEGGMFRLVEALVRVGKSLGVRYRYNTKVTGLRVERRQVRGLELDNETLWAPAVVVNADVAHLAESLWPRSPSSLRPKQTPSTSGWTAIIRAKPDPRRAAHTVLFPADYKQEFVDLFDRRRTPDDPTVYLCAQTEAHGRGGWSDAQPVFAMVNAPPHGGPTSTDWHEVEQRVQSKLLRSGFVVTDEIIWRRTPRGLAQRFAGSQGSLYGAASNGPRAAFTRPPNRVPGVRGLYLASGSAHPGGGMPLAAQSGRLAAQAMIEDFGRAERRSA